MQEEFIFKGSYLPWDGNQHQGRRINRVGRPAAHTATTSRLHFILIGRGKHLVFKSIKVEGIVIPISSYWVGQKSSFGFFRNIFEKSSYQAQNCLIFFFKLHYTHVTLFHLNFKGGIGHIWLPYASEELFLQSANKVFFSYFVRFHWPVSWHDKYVMPSRPAWLSVPSPLLPPSRGSCQPTPRV